MFIIKHETGKYIPRELSWYLHLLINRDNDLSFLSKKSKKVFQTKKGAETFLEKIDSYKRNQFEIIELKEK